MKGKVAIITGASSGIGAGTAAFLASKRCLLALTGRNVANLESTREQCIENGAQENDVLLIPADLEKKEDIRRVVDKTVQKFEKIDILINNAGMAKLDGLETMSLTDYDTMFNVNVRSVFYLTQLAVPHLIKNQGNIICVSSVVGLRPFGGGFIAYSMTKAALDHFIRISALELASKKVRVNGVNPGLIPTNFYKNSGLKLQTSELEAMSERMHALGRPGTIEEVARAIAFLANDEESAFITGVNLPVDGGCVLKGPM